MSRRDYLKHLGFATAAAMAAANQTKAMSNEPTIDQINEAIAVFMGMKGSRDFIRMNYNRYHCNWDALMPVGKRIRDLLSDMLSKRPPHTACMGDVIEVDITCALHEYDIKKVHEAIYVFIQWYNKQQSNEQTK